jgi:hypothetical protein
MQKLQQVAAARVRPATSRKFDVAKETAQRDFLESIGDRIDSDPGGEHWKTEFETAVREQFSPEEIRQTQFLQSVEKFAQHFKKPIEQTILPNARKLSFEDALVRMICEEFMLGGVLTQAITEARQDYAGLTHRHYNLLVRLATGAPSAIPCYSSLCELEKGDGSWRAFVEGAIAVATSKSDRGGGLGGFHCVTSPAVTTLERTDPKFMTPDGYGQPASGDEVQGGYQFSLDDCAVVKFISAGGDAVGLHTAVSKDDTGRNFCFPPMTMFSVEDVELGSFEYDGTAELLAYCKKNYRGESPVPVLNANGRPHVTKQQLLTWVRGANPQFADNLFAEQTLMRGQMGIGGPAMGFFHNCFLPPGVESSIYTVNQPLVTVRASYRLPAVAATASTVAGSNVSPGAGRGDSALDKLTASSDDLL